LMNRSRGEYACTILDLDDSPSDHVIQTLTHMEGVLKVRKIG